MPIAIPKPHLQPLRQLATMTPDDRKRLVGAIAGTHPVLVPGELTRHIIDKTGFQESLVKPIVSMLLSMMRTSSEAPDGFAGDVVEAARIAFDDDENIDWDSFSEHLHALLQPNDALGVTAKALSVRSEYENVYCSARILTDLRPVFGRDASKSPEAAAIVHTLRITYHAAGDYKEAYFALDALDLSQLRGLIHRAEMKEKTLQAVVGKTGMKLLREEPE